MSARAVSWLAWSLCALSVMLAIAAAALGLSEGSDLVIVFSVAALGLVFALIGALIASRLPRNPIGWILCAAAFLFEFSVFSDAYVAYGSQVSSPDTASKK